jgi:hypothetical protein
MKKANKTKKSKVKVRDLKPKKDAKGGSSVHGPYKNPYLR